MGKGSRKEWGDSTYKKEARGDYGVEETGCHFQHCLLCSVLTFCSPVPRYLSRHLHGCDGSTKAPLTAPTLAADPAGAGAGTALLWPGSHVPTVPAATCGPRCVNWQ